MLGMAYKMYTGKVNAGKLVRFGPLEGLLMVNFARKSECQGGVNFGLRLLGIAFWHDYCLAFLCVYL